MSTEIPRRRLVTTADIIEALNASEELTADGDTLKIDRSKLPADLVTSFPGESGTFILTDGNEIGLSTLKGCTVERTIDGNYLVRWDVPFADNAYFFHAAGATELGGMVQLSYGSVQTGLKTTEYVLIYMVEGIKEVWFVASGEKESS